MVLDEKRKRIVELPINQLIKKLQDGHLSCLDVLKAYQAKVINRLLKNAILLLFFFYYFRNNQFQALEVTQQLNCVTEFIREAEVSYIIACYVANILKTRGALSFSKNNDDYITPFHRNGQRHLTSKVARKGPFTAFRSA